MLAFSVAKHLELKLKLIRSCNLVLKFQIKSALAALYYFPIPTFYNPHIG